MLILIVLLPALALVTTATETGMQLDATPRRGGLGGHQEARASLGWLSVVSDLGIPSILGRDAGTARSFPATAATASAVPC